MKTVLVIEDDLLVQNLFVVLLEAEGYRTLGAEDGLEGVRLALEERPDLVLTDLSLPGLDGYGVVARLRQEGMRVVAITGHSGEDELIKIKGSGFVGYLGKPIDPLTFVRELQAWL